MRDLPREIAALVTPLTDREVEQLLSAGGPQDWYETPEMAITRNYGTRELEVFYEVHPPGVCPLEIEALDGHPGIVVIDDLRCRPRLYRCEDVDALIAAATAYNRQRAAAAVADVFARLLAFPPHEYEEYDVIEDGLRHIYPPHNEWSRLRTVAQRDVYVFPFALPFVRTDLVYFHRDGKFYRTTDDCYVSILGQDGVPDDAEERVPRALTLDQLEAGDEP